MSGGQIHVDRGARTLDRLRRALQKMALTLKSLVPLSQKGDLPTFGTSPTRLPVGTDGFALLADSSAPLGLTYAPVVTSVGVTASGSLSGILSFSGSPVTTAGTITLSLSTQSANKVLAGPSSGSAAVPFFRAVVPLDLGTGTANSANVLRGDQTFTNILLGDWKLGAAGNGLYIKEGSNATMGLGTFASGITTISTTKITNNTRVNLSVQSLGTVTLPKSLGVTSRTAGTSFVVKSGDATDTSIFSWVFIEPA